MPSYKNLILGLTVAGIASAPIFASTAAEAVGTTVQTVIASQITAFSNTNSGNTTLNIVSPSGVKQTIDKDTISVSTNDSNGYTLKIQDGNTSNALCVVQGAACTGIPGTAATSAAPAIMSGANQWGYHIDDGTTTWCSTAVLCGSLLTLPSNSAATSTTLKFAQVPLSSGTADTIKTTATTASSDTTPVYYGVNVDPTQASGTYSDTVVYTATAN
jgi:hypothetical protein